MQEIEVKILEIDEKEIRKKLDVFAKKISENVLLVTSFFNSPIKNVSVRLRQASGENTFCVKQAIYDENFKVRNEYETKVDNFDIFVRQLELLGFKKSFSHQKERTTYKYKNSEIVMDKYPKIPTFLEIEGSKEEIKEIVWRLGYSMNDVENINFLELFRKYGLID